MSTPRAPKGLGPTGRAFWRAMVDEFEFGPHEMRILRDAAATVDTIDALERAAKDVPLRAKGSAGQPVIAPEVAELRVQRALLASLVARLKVPGLDDDQENDPMSDTEKARRAVVKRYEGRS